MNCKAVNIINSILWLKCSKLVYVGETEGTLPQIMLH